MPDEEDRLEQNDRRRYARRGKQRGRHRPGLGTTESASRYQARGLGTWERRAPFADPIERDER